MRFSVLSGRISPLALARYPGFCDFLREVYLSCGWQIAAIVVILGLTENTEDITKFCTCARYQRNYHN